MMVPLNTSLFSLLFLLLRPHCARLYSLRNCTIDSDDPMMVSCKNELSTIPSNIPRSVVVLSFAQNKIQKIQRSDFRGLSRLQILDLSHNQISVIEDAAFSHLSALTKLSLCHNRLKDLTDSTFEGLSNLTTLDLGENKIKIITEHAFVDLINLQSLCLSRNSLSRTSDILNVVLSCPSLQVLDLTYNFLTLFDLEHFPCHLNVTELNLSKNPLHRFTLHSDRLPFLETLYLADVNSPFQWDVSDRTFLKNLKTLDLSWTNFTTETYQLVFKSVDSVENLILRGSSHVLNKHVINLACGIPSLQKLDLSMTAIAVLNNSFLQICTNLTDLNLSENPMTNLSASCLRMLTRLSKLAMTLNLLSRIPLTISNMSSLTSLSFIRNRITKLHCLDFANLRQLSELNLSDNNLIELNSCVFQDLHSLKRLYLDNNFIHQFYDSFSTTLPNLLFLTADNNNIARLQKRVFKNMSRLKNLEVCTLGGTQVEEGAWEGLSDLKELAYSPSLFSTDLGASAGSNSTTAGHSGLLHTDLPSLHTLSIAVSVKGCLLFTQDFLQGLDNLKEFSASNFFCKSPHKEMFRNTPLLQDLTIFLNDNLSPAPEVFHPITRLQRLDLSQNHLKSLDFLSQANLTELQKLILTDNDLVVINETVFKALPSLKYIDFSENPFVCNCSNAGFIYWVLTNKQVYVNDAFSYRCASPPSDVGHFLLDFDFQSCWDFPGFICFIFSSALVLVTLLSTFTYHFLRWQLVYGFYLLRAFVYDSKKRRQGCPDVYDAFVSYNVHDEEWVYRELVPELEERQGWRLCLHHRDFEPGKAIMENITDAIYSSRKTLCVISRHYLQSEWCSREIQMASFRLLDEQKDVLILLLLEELSSAELSPFYRVRKLMSSRTYLSWSGARSHRGLFWERVRRALQCGAEISTDNPLYEDL